MHGKNLKLILKVNVWRVSKVVKHNYIIIIIIIM